jgi:hypothetical protein
MLFCLVDSGNLAVSCPTCFLRLPNRPPDQERPLGTVEALTETGCGHAADPGGGGGVDGLISRRAWLVRHAGWPHPTRHVFRRPFPPDRSGNSWGKRPQDIHDGNNAALEPSCHSICEARAGRFARSPMPGPIDPRAATVQGAGRTTWFVYMNANQLQLSAYLALLSLAFQRIRTTAAMSARPLLTASQLAIAVANCNLSHGLNTD